ASPELYTLSLHDALPISSLQPSFVPMRPSSSRRTSSSVACAGTSSDRFSPLTTNVSSNPPPLLRLTVMDSRDRCTWRRRGRGARSEEHTSELQSRGHLVC